MTKTFHWTTDLAPTICWSTIRLNNRSTQNTWRTWNCIAFPCVLFKWRIIHEWCTLDAISPFLFLCRFVLIYYFNEILIIIDWLIDWFSLKSEMKIKTEITEVISHTETSTTWITTNPKVKSCYWLVMGVMCHKCLMKWKWGMFFSEIKCNKKLSTHSSTLWGAAYRHLFY